MRHPLREEEPALHGRRLGPGEPDTPSRGVDEGKGVAWAGTDVRGARSSVVFCVRCLTATPEPALLL